MPRHGSGIPEDSHRGSSPTLPLIHWHTHAWTLLTLHTFPLHILGTNKEQLLEMFMVCKVRSYSLPLFSACAFILHLPLSFFSAQVPLPHRNITDIMNFLNVKCNFIARCLLWQNLWAEIVVSMWKRSKVSYFRGSCIFYLTSSSPLWKEAEESKNTFTLVCLLHAAQVSQAG